MNTATLIILIALSNGQYIQHVKHITGAYAYNTCQWKKASMIKRWSLRDDVTHLDIRCLNIWDET